jgi:hypothetical protein
MTTTRSPTILMNTVHRISARREHTRCTKDIETTSPQPQCCEAVLEQSARSLSHPCLRSRMPVQLSTNQPILVPAKSQTAPTAPGQECHHAPNKLCAGGAGHQLAHNTSPLSSLTPAHPDSRDYRAAEVASRFLDDPRWPAQGTDALRPGASSPYPAAGTNAPFRNLGTMANRTPEVPAARIEASCRTSFGAPTA